MLQNSCLRIVSKRARLDSAHAMHIELEVEWLDESRAQHTCHFVFKALHGMAPEKTAGMFIRLADQSERTTRATESNFLYVDPTRLRTVESGNIRVRGSVYWNYAPSDIRTIDRFNTYKSRLSQEQVFQHDILIQWI